MSGNSVSDTAAQNTKNGDSSTGAPLCAAAKTAKDANSVCALWNEATWFHNNPCTKNNVGQYFKNCNGLFKCSADGKSLESVEDRPAVGNQSTSPNINLLASNEEAITSGLGVMGQCAMRGEINIDKNSEQCYGGGNKAFGDFHVDLCTGPISQASLDISNQRADESMANLANLQNMEKDLYKQLERLNANDASIEKQQDVMDKIKDVADMRISLFKGLRDMYTQSQDSVAQTRVDLVDQLTVLGVVNGELDNARSQLKELEGARAGKVRMAEINTYYGKRYKAHAELMKLIVMVCIPIMILVVLQRKGFIPDKFANPILTVIIAIGVLLVVLRIWDLSWRNNMNYDEYDWAWDADANDPTVVEYDVRQMKKSDGGRGIIHGIEDVAKDVGKALDFCVGGNCCGRDTYYDHAKGRCSVDTSDLDVRKGDDGFGGNAIPGGATMPGRATMPPGATMPGSITEGFDTEYMTQTSYVADPSPTCPWKAESTTVHPYSPTGV